MNTSVTAAVAVAPRQKSPPRAHAKPDSPARPTSRPFFTLPVKLYTHQAQQVFRRVFNHLSHGLYQMSVVLRIIADDKGVEQVEGVVKEEFAAIEKEIRDEIARLSTLLDKHAVTNSAQYTNALEAHAEISSPMASRFLGIITQLDELVKLIGALWLTGALNNSQYTAGAYKWQRIAIKFAGRVSNYCLRAVAAARRPQQVGDSPGASLEEQADAATESESNGSGNGHDDEGEERHAVDVELLIENVRKGGTTPAAVNGAAKAQDAQLTSAAIAAEPKKGASKVKAERKRA